MARLETTTWRSGLLRTSAALVGSLGLALAVTLFLARVAPLPLFARYALAHFLWLPIWAGAACFGFVARSGGRAWAAYLILTISFVMLSRLGG